MVTRIEKAMWKCPICSQKYDDEFACVDHIEDYHSESPIESKEIIYKCEMCKEEFEKKSDASECETNHKEGNDWKYKAYLEQLERDKLTEASMHPSQKKLL